MKKLVKAAAVAAVVAGGLGTVGCAGGPSAQDRAAGWYDPCWPERYAHQARMATLQPFAAHVANGAIVDATLFNYHFESGTDRLNPAGLQKIDYLARRRPAPDRMVYLQTARDMAYEVADPDKMVVARQDLDTRRSAAIQRYVTASTAGRNVAVDVTVIDPGDMTFTAQGPANAVRGYPGRFASGIGGVNSNNVQGAGGQILTVAPAGGNQGGGQGGVPGGGGAAGGGGTGGGSQQ